MSGAGAGSGDTHSRRGFLRGLFSSAAREIVAGLDAGLGGAAATAPRGATPPVCRPPGAAIPEARFLDLCSAPVDGCRRCVDVCPERCIIPAQPDVPGHPRAGTPFLLPAEAACTLCGLCQPACPTGALLPIAPADARIGLAVVDHGRCRGGRPDGCSACVTACPFPGVAIALLAGGDPRVDAEACTGCGLCAPVCPTLAVRVVPRLAAS